MRRTSVAALAASCALSLAACSPAGRDVAPSPSPSVPASATAEVTASPTPTFAGPDLLTVDPSLIEGIDVEVEESLERGLYSYVAFPLFPNGADLTALMRDAVTYRLERFREVEQAGTGDADPELTVSWDIVGASPRMVGVRLTSAESGSEQFDGGAQTVWIDLDSRARVWTPELFAPESAGDLIDSIRDAALADPRIDERLLNEQLDGDLEAFDSVAFTPEGDLWIEFGRAQVSTSTTPIGVAVDPAGLLSDLGEIARDAALNPADPAIAPPATPEPETPAPSTPDAPAPVQTQETTGDHDCTQLTCIALTFDDGPVEGTTELLDVLASRGVKATFFMVGKNVTAHPDVARRVAEDGHAIGTHTWDHPQLTRLDAASIRAELTRSADAIEEATGQRPALVRPPYGATNDTVAGVAADLGMPQILWDVDPEDWKDKNSAVVQQRVLDAAHRNAIILSHDIHPTTRGAYAAIIDGLLADGYTLVTVPDLIDDLVPGAKYFSGG